MADAVEQKKINKSPHEHQEAMNRFADKLRIMEERRKEDEKKYKTIDRAIADRKKREAAKKRDFDAEHPLFKEEDWMDM